MKPRENSPSNAHAVGIEDIVQRLVLSRSL
jgi:hypothetical protein